MVIKESVGRKKVHVWFDICHTPQYNFYKNLIIRLAEEGHLVYITVLNRGKMPLIIQKELIAYPTIKIYIIGKDTITDRMEANVPMVLFWLISRCPAFTLLGSTYTTSFCCR